MLAKITLYDGTIYRIADKTTDTEDGIYLGRIKDELSLVSAMQEAGNAPATINLTIINHDDFIPHSKDLWAADVLLTNDNGVSWRGKINFCNFDADGNLYVTASEKTAPELELQLPDEVRQVYTVDEDFHQSSVTMTIPLVIGGTHEKPILVPTILIDKTQGIYLICVGEIREVVNVYSGSEKLPQWEYNSWRGTAEQPYHKGFAYVTIGYNKRFNADGSYAEINVEVVGLKLGNFTEEECRNGALFLYYFLTTAATGINGWGCGIDQSEIDTASFQSAITLCNQLGYKLDGIMWLRQSAQSWIDQICQAIHGKYSINANGKRSLFIDYAGNASKKTFTASNMQVDKYGKNSYTSVVYNKGILSYDYNPITGLFMQSAQYENAESIAQIGEQKFVGESYLLKDPTTALAVLEYTCKRSQTAAEAIEFKTDDVDTVLRAGDVITINRPDLSINNALYQIQNISITDYEASISAVKFDISVFIVSGTPSSVNWGSEKAITPALTPAQATNLLLSTGFDINPDGTGTPYISGTFTVPEGGWLAAAVQYGIGTNPSNWTELALITEGRFKLSPVNVGTVYSIRVRMITSTGHSDYITGQITATGDTIPPSEPTIAVKATDKTVTVQCGLDNPPYDMGGFQIFRKKSTEQVYTYIGSIAANRGYASFSDYVDEYVTYDYQAKSYDRSGNLSTNFSNVASVTVTGIQANDVAATALAMPTGSILRLSAKNCHGAEDTGNEYPNHISDVNGVKDVSGNGNHGQAGSGVSVVNNEEKGFCFSFDRSNNTASKLTFGQNLKTSTATGLTISIRFISTEINILQILFDCYSHNNRTSLTIYENNDLGWSGCGILDHRTPQKIEVNKWYEYTVVYGDEGTIKTYLDSELIDSTNMPDGADNPTLIGNSYVGNRFASNNLGLKGLISYFRIYPRALSASEIKTLYMFPDDVTFGQMTADLIGANVIKADNLIKTDKVISTVAQIDQAVFQSLIVTNGSTVANQVDVGGRNLLKNSNNGGNGWNNANYPTCSIYLGNDKPKAGDTVTISFKATVDWTKISQFAVFNSGGSVPLVYIAQSSFDSNGVCRKSFSWKISKGSTTAANTHINIYASLVSGATRPSITINWVKLEYGNKSTTWTPAPEDTDASINTVQSNLDTVTTNIYSPNTTTINGGKITTGTIQAAAIAANAITAKKLSVLSQRPTGCVLWLSAKGMKTSADGDKVADISGSDNNFKFVGSSWSILNNANGWKLGCRANNGLVLLNTTTISLNASAFTIFFNFYFDDTDFSKQPILFDFQNGSNNKNRILGFLTTNGVLQINSYDNANGTATQINTDFTVTKSRFYDLAVVAESTTSIKVYVGIRNGTMDLKKTATVGTRANLSASKIGFCNNASNSANRSFKGFINNIQVWNTTALTAEQIAYLHYIGEDPDGGMITAERLTTDAIKSRNYAAGPDSTYPFASAGTFIDTANGNIYNKSFFSTTDKGAAFRDGNRILAINKGYGLDYFETSTSISDNSGGLAIETTGNYGIDIKSGAKTRGIRCARGIESHGYSVSAFYGDTNSGSYCIQAINNGSGDAIYGLSSGGKGGVFSTESSTAYALYVNGKAYCTSGTWTACDESIKRDIKDVSTLEKLKDIRVKKFKYSEKIIKTRAWIERKKKEIKDGIPLEDRSVMPVYEDDENSPEYIMAMAGEFNKAFGVDNGNEESINYTNAIGVALRAIQELAEIVDSQKAEIAELKALLKNQGALPDSGKPLPEDDEKTDAEPVSDSGKPLPDEVQQDEKSDTEQK